MPIADMENFVPREIQDAMIKHFDQFGLSTHMREWKVTKIPGMEEYDIDIKIHVNKFDPDME